MGARVGFLVVLCCVVLAEAAEASGQIQQDQACLTRLGYDPGPVDGRWGARSQAALDAWAKQTFHSHAAQVTPEATITYFRGVCSPVPYASQAPLPRASARTFQEATSARQDTSRSPWVWVLIASLMAVFLLPMGIAYEKGRSGVGFFVYSFFLWPIAFIHALVMEPSAAVATQQAVKRGDLRRCPFCQEWIQTTASRCKHCQAEMVPGRVAS